MKNKEIAASRATRKDKPRTSRWSGQLVRKSPPRGANPPLPLGKGIRRGSVVPRPFGQFHFRVELVGWGVAGEQSPVIRVRRCGRQAFEHLLSVGRLRVIPIV